MKVSAKRRVIRPTQTCSEVRMVAEDGIEPPTRGFSIPISMCTYVIDSERVRLESPINR